MQVEDQRTKAMWQGAVYLSLAVLITKILSAAYRIPYQNIAGDIGFYVYQQVYPIYGIALVLATYGFPVIISKLVSEQIAVSNINGAKQISRFAFFSLSIFGLCTFSFFFFSAGFVAKVMADENLIVPLQAVSFSFLLVPILAVLRGYFQGQENMIPTAVSQVTEQAVRVITILVLTYFLIINGYGPYAAGAGAAIGSVFGALFAIIILSYFIIREKRLKVDSPITKPISAWLVIKRLFYEGFLICITALVLILFQFVDALTIVRFLQYGGITDTIAIISKGVYDRGQPLIQLGTVVATALSLALVPMITKSKANGEQQSLQQKCELALRVTLLIGVGAAAGLATIIEPTNVMLFTDRSGSSVLAILGISIVFSSIILATAAIMQGLDYTSIPAYHILIGVVVKIILNIALIPYTGTVGAALATVIGLAVVAILNIVFIQRKLQLIIIQYRYVRVIILSAFIMIAATFLWKEMIGLVLLGEEDNRLIAAVIALSSVFVGAITYLFVLIRFRMFTEEELATIPKLNKLTKFIYKKE